MVPCPVAHLLPLPVLSPNERWCEGVWVGDPETSNQFAATMDLKQVLSWQISWDFLTNIFGWIKLSWNKAFICLNRIYHINITGFWNPSTVIYKIYVFPTNEPRQMSVKHPLALNFAPQQGPQHREQVNLRPQILTKNTCIYIYMCIDINHLHKKIYSRKKNKTHKDT